MFHILDFAGTAGMTAKVTRCATFKNSHKEKEMRETNLHNNHLMISWSVKSEVRKTIRFLTPAFGVTVSLTLGSQDTHWNIVPQSYECNILASVRLDEWTERRQEQGGRWLKHLPHAENTTSLCEKVKEREKRGGETDRQTDRNDIMTWVLPPCSVRCGLQLQGSKCWLHGGRECSLMDHCS